jgi:hypothetical protein
VREKSISLKRQKSPESLPFYVRVPLLFRLIVLATAVFSISALLPMSAAA